MIIIKNQKIISAQNSCKILLKLTSKAISKLNSARNWGAMDIIGGGKMISYVKRRKIRKYRKLLERIDVERKNLAKDLRGLGIDPPAKVSSAGAGLFGSLIDIFADNFAIDAMSQVNIARTKKDLKAFRKEVKDIEKELKRL